MSAQNDAIDGPKAQISCGHHIVPANLIRYSDGPTKGQAANRSET
jgi:hypothetical protein